MLAKKLWGVKVIYDIFDFYADHIRANRWIKNLIRIVDRKIISQVDAVILVDEARKVQIDHCRVKRCEIIYNSPPDRLNSLSAIPGGRAPKDGFQIGYVGMMLNDRGLLELIQVLKSVPNGSSNLPGLEGTRI